MRTLRLLMVPLALSGCVTLQSRPRGPGPTYEQFARQLKYEVGTYLWRHRNDPEVTDYRAGQSAGADVSGFEADARAGKIRLPTATEKCPNQLNITIKRVKFTTTTSITGKQSGSAGIELPIGTATVSPSLAGSREIKNEVTTVLTFDPDPNADITEEPKPVLGPDGEPVFAGAIIADTIDAITTALKRTSDTRPCFEFPDDPKATNTIKWGVTYTTSSTQGGKFKILIFSLGADNTRTRAAANTIEIELYVTGGFGGS